MSTSLLSNLLLRLEQSTIVIITTKPNNPNYTKIIYFSCRIYPWSVSIVSRCLLSLLVQTKSLTLTFFPLLHTYLLFYYSTFMRVHYSVLVCLFTSPYFCVLVHFSILIYLSLLHTCVLVYYSILKCLFTTYLCACSLLHTYVLVYYSILMCLFTTPYLSARSLFLKKSNRMLLHCSNLGRVSFDLFFSYISHALQSLQQRCDAVVAGGCFLKDTS